MIQSIPNDVKKYFNDGPKKLLKVEPSINYTLILYYDDNSSRLYNMSDKLFGVFSLLKNVEKFNRVFIDENGNIAWNKDENVDSNIVWNNRIDICSDSAYLNSTPC